MNEARPIHLDLFSGIGGFALAAHWAGFKTIGFCEIEPYGQAVLKKHWPGVPVESDIQQLDGRRYSGVDLLTGGFPCQPFSFAGKRRGAADDRFLWPEMLRVIAESRPAWVVGENVAGFVSMELDRCISDLEGISYTARPIIVPACAVDAKHRRGRVWIVANANDRRSDRLREQPGRAQVERTSQTLADSESGARQRQAQWEARHSALSGEALANGNRSGLEGRQEQSTRQEQSAAVRGSAISDTNGDNGLGRSGAVQVGRQCGAGEVALDGYTPGVEWQPEPELGRVAHGIPRKVTALKDSATPSSHKSRIKSSKKSES